MTKHRVAILGLNHYHVTGWLGSLRSLGETLDVVCVHDPDPARLEAEGPDHSDPSLPRDYPSWLRNVPFESDLDRMLDAYKPEIALVTLPNASASDAIARLANAGVHILSDKPGGVTARDVASAFDIARQSGVKAAVALTRRYSPGWRDAKAVVESGALGRLLSTESVFVTSSVAVRGATNTIFSREQMGGGVLHWLGIHDLDALRWLTEDPIVNVLARTATTGGNDIDVEDTVSASIQYASGAIGTVHLAYALPRSTSDGYIALRGTKGSLRITPDGSWTFTGPASPLEPLATRTSKYEFGPSTGYGTIGTPIIQDLLDAIHDDREPLARGRDAANALSVVEAMYESAARGKPIDVTYQE
ncbi:MAG TPA: Gfo/Idh/MocA family oxidoreductase [Thermomicrobiales bacterium]|nr:Gfo/Idh/MocA family oxidoreductase [Thermomicrobiales bacterium]